MVTSSIPGKTFGKFECESEIDKQLRVKSKRGTPRSYVESLLASNWFHPKGTGYKKLTKLVE